MPGRLKRASQDDLTNTGSSAARWCSYLLSDRVCARMPTNAGLLLDFGARSLKWKRSLLPSRQTASSINRQLLFVPSWIDHQP